MIFFIVTIAAALLIFYLAGRRLPIDATVRPVTLPADLDGYLLEKESRFNDITPGTAAKIIWADPTHKKTPFAVVYLHGFSATNRETAPLSDSVASALKANLYYPRLTGHGRTGEALANATLNDWLNDANEAIEIGRRLGDRVIVIATSTGATLTAWIAGRPEGADLYSLVLISPNLGLRDKILWQLLTLWAGHPIPIAGGLTGGFKPFNPDHEKYWTSRYPASALLPMVRLVNLVRKRGPMKIPAPVLMVYSPNDRLLDIAKVERFYTTLQTKNKHAFRIMKAGNEECHIIAGDILSPETTPSVTKEIIRFISGIAEHRTADGEK